ncbi:MAG: hypothetical protein KGH95_03365 [Thaumarchaeota archaeon]|nr:hypothetical protein [Nitrososphaerota archaeon]
MKKKIILLCASTIFLLATLATIDKESSGFQNTINASRSVNLHIHGYRTVVILPIFTQAAYGPHGFYWFYEKNCGPTCLTVPIPKNFTASYVTGGGMDGILLNQNFTYLTDLDIDRNPNILTKYDKIILLHNEYVTQSEFDAIVHHPHVIYMYPNALYAKVSIDYSKNTITLVKGHGYPQKSIHDGFEWRFDNSRYEYNTACKDWSFYKIENGYMLDCYPQLVIQNNNLMLEKMILL